MIATGDSYQSLSPAYIALSSALSKRLHSQLHGHCCAAADHQILHTQQPWAPWRSTLWAMDYYALCLRLSTPSAPDDFLRWWQSLAELGLDASNLWHLPDLQACHVDNFPAQLAEYWLQALLKALTPAWQARIWQEWLAWTLPRLPTAEVHPPDVATTATAATLYLHAPWRDPAHYPDLEAPYSSAVWQPSLCHDQAQTVILLGSAAILGHPRPARMMTDPLRAPISRLIEQLQDYPDRIVPGVWIMQSIRLLHPQRAFHDWTAGRSSPAHWTCKDTSATQLLQYLRALMEVRGA